MSRKEQPTVESARVQIVSPTGLPAPGAARVKGAGPRNPDQRTLPVPKGPGIELPDGRPVMKAQRIWIDPELLMKWEEEHRREATERATTRPATEPEGQEQPSDPPVKSP
jgi:hypothetical protein